MSDVDILSLRAERKKPRRQELFDAKHPDGTPVWPRSRVEDETAIVDRFGVWNDFCQRFLYQDVLDTTLADRFKLARALQNHFNEYLTATGADRSNGGCAGMGQLTRVTSDVYRCHHPLCPSCHAVNMEKCLWSIRFKLPQFEHVYLRETNLLSPLEPLPSALFKTFQANKTRYELMAWSVAFEQDTTNTREAEIDEKHTNYPIVLKYVGVYGARPVNGVHKPIEERGVSVKHRYLAGQQVLRHGTVIDRGTGQGVGAVERTDLGRPDFESLKELWFHKIGHPSEVRWHSSYPEVIKALRNWATRFYQTGMPHA